MESGGIFFFCQVESYTVAERNLGDRVHLHTISVGMCAEKYSARRPLGSSTAALSQASLTAAGQITSQGRHDIHGLSLTDNAGVPRGYFYFSQFQCFLRHVHHTAVAEK